MKEKMELNAIFSVNGEMVKDNGEDSFCFATDKDNSIVGVFDGCGGAGAKKYGRYSLKSGAYIASRAVCGSVKCWFDEECDKPVREYLEKAMDMCSKFADNKSRLVGSLGGKSFPTTAAFMKNTVTEKGVEVTCYWAGDSRCYMIDEDGLHQLSCDDLEGEDAYSNIKNDGVLTNAITAEKDFILHEKKFIFDKPCILFSATDGCFGYLDSPMDFEYLILQNLIFAKSISEWKSKLKKEFAQSAGDDYTFVAAVFGLDSFQKVRTHFSKRRDFVYRNYIEQKEETEKKWEEYKESYNKYL